MGSWSVLYSTQLRAKPMSASFFADGDTVYAETLGLPETSFRERQQVVIDLPNRKSTERMSSSLVGDPTMNYFALSQSHLVGVEYVRGQGQRALVLAALPDYRAVARTLRREEPPAARQSKKHRTLRFRRPQRSGLPRRPLYCLPPNERFGCDLDATDRARNGWSKFFFPHAGWGKDCRCCHGHLFHC
jgi:hypothetical protein